MAEQRSTKYLLLGSGLAVLVAGALWSQFTTPKVTWPDFRGQIYVAVQTAVGKDPADAQGGVYRLTHAEQQMEQVTNQFPTQMDVSRDASLLVCSYSDTVELQSLTLDEAPKTITVPGLQSVPVCSDDGSWIAWTAMSMDKAEELQTSMAKIADMQTEALQSVGPEPIIYDWSDQQRAFLATIPEGPAESNVALVTKSGAVRRLTDAGLNVFPRFSHDGKKVLFVKQEEGLSSIMLHDLDANEAKLIYGPTAMLLRQCCWSPDDKMVGFLIKEDPEAIQILEIGTDMPKRLLVPRAKWIGDLVWNLR